MASPGLILDRDGTIVEERGYIADAVDLVALAGVTDTLARVRAAGVVVAVVTNQSAVARGIVSESELEVLHERIRSLGVDAVYHCPHLPDAGCECRKPRPGLMQRAVAELGLDPERTLVVGDNITDCLAARAAGLAAVLVRTGHGQRDAAAAEAEGFPVAEDLAAAVDHLLVDMRQPRPSEGRR
jgi:histidinol-phosphate phosphatase family protein